MMQFCLPGGCDPDLELLVHAGAAFHHRGNKLQRRCLRHGADAADRSFVPRGIGADGRAQPQGWLSQALESTAAPPPPTPQRRPLPQGLATTIRRQTCRCQSFQDTNGWIQ